MSLFILWLSFIRMLADMNSEEESGTSVATRHERSPA